MTVIDTSTSSTATAYSNQRKIDRCQNGVLWALGNKIPGAFAWEFWYSTDDGATWTFDNNSLNSGSSDTHTANGSIFIDVDDYMHFVYKDGTDGYIYYRRGTPNAGRTDWTWSAATLIWDANTTADYPDVVACPTPGGSTWDVFITWSQYSNLNNLYTLYQRRRIASDGTVGAVELDGLTAYAGSGILGGNYGLNSHTYPSIDFNHTGDGKTVSGSTPHLYAAWSAGTTGSGKGIRFRKATYSGGSWTWGTDREISTGHYIASGSYPLNCLFDGTRVIIGGCLFTGAARDEKVWERDAADTTTSTLVSDTSLALADSPLFGSMTYDADGNIYRIGGYSSSTNINLSYYKWDRATATRGSWVEIDATVGAPYATFKRGSSDNLIEFIYTDGTSSPYDVTYGQIELASGAFVGWGIPMGIA